MKIDSQIIFVGMGFVGVVAGGLGLWGRRLSRIFAVCLVGFLFFELFCFITGLELLVPIWWAVHTPSAIALGADEILERHGAVVSTVFHLGDLFLWSTLITGILWLKEMRRRDGAIAEPRAAEHGSRAKQTGNSDVKERPPSVSQMVQREGSDHDRTN